MNNDLSAGLLLLPLLLVVSASAWAWWRALARVAAGHPVLAFESRMASPWGLLDLIIAFFLLVACQVFASGLLVTKFGIQIADDMSADGRAALLFGGALATLAAFLSSIAVVRLRSGATWIDLGINRTCLASDLQLGAVAFVMLAPIVYGIQMVLVKWFESQHPLNELLRKDPDPKFFVLAGIAALIVAPLAEEYFFRVLLQGWLERIATRASATTHLLLGGRPGDTVALSANDQPQLHSYSYASPIEETPSHVGGDRERTRPLWPILVSACLFALAHYSHGPDPIPLFVLAVGLGYLYRQTHRVLPCIVVHFLLNSCSLAALCWSVFFGE